LFCSEERSVRMAAVYCIEPEIGCVFIRHSGEFIAGEGPVNLGEILNDPDYRPGMNIFRDSRQTELPPEFNYDYFKKTRLTVMAAVEKRLGRCKMGWIVANSHDYAIIHQLSVSSRLTPDSIQRRPFREVGPALKWLGIPEDYVFKYLSGGS